MSPMIFAGAGPLKSKHIDQDLLSEHVYGKIFAQTSTPSFPWFAEIQHMQ